ncbi:hypothetical protein TWF281_010776 [Arthrobotrys megalospora]
MEDLANIKFYHEDIMIALNLFGKSVLDVDENDPTRADYMCKLAPPLPQLPPLPRESYSESLLLARASFQKDVTLPREANTGYFPWEVQILLGGCTKEDRESENLQTEVPVQSTESIEAISLAGFITPPGPSRPTGLVFDKIPINDRGWRVEVVGEAYARPFQQNNNLANLAKIGERIKEGRIKPVFDYRSPPYEGNCQQHYCDPSSSIKVSICGEDSHDDLFVPEAIERTVLGIDRHGPTRWSASET